jgi:periplasmic divalent cation tolerance protein
MMKRQASPPPIVTALTTAPSAEKAKRLVRELVERRVIACGTVLPGAVSTYWWQGAVAEEEEVVVVMKTTAARWPELAATLPGLHPYEVPELIVLPVVDGHRPYLDWVRAETGVRERAGTGARERSRARKRGGTRRGAGSSGQRIGSVAPDSARVGRGRKE